MTQINIAIVLALTNEAIRLKNGTIQEGDPSELGLSEECVAVYILGSDRKLLEKPFGGSKTLGPFSFLELVVQNSKPLVFLYKKADQLHITAQYIDGDGLLKEKDYKVFQGTPDQVLCDMICNKYKAEAHVPIAIDDIKKPSEKKIISLLNELDTKGRFSEPFSLVPGTKVQVTINKYDFEKSLVDREKLAGLLDFIKGTNIANILCFGIDSEATREALENKGYSLKKIPTAYDFYKSVEDVAQKRWVIHREKLQAEEEELKRKNQKEKEEQERKKQEEKEAEEKRQKEQVQRQEEEEKKLKEIQAEKERKIQMEIDAYERARLEKEQKEQEKKEAARKAAEKTEKEKRKKAQYRKLLRVFRNTVMLCVLGVVIYWNIRPSGEDKLQLNGSSQFTNKQFYGEINRSSAILQFGEAVNPQTCMFTLGGVSSDFESPREVKVYYQTQHMEFEKLGRAKFYFEGNNIIIESEQTDYQFKFTGIK
jgi:hypothetical protein